MAFEVAGPASLVVSFEAGADLHLKQYYFVKFNSSGKVILCDTDGEAALGILQNTPTSGQAAAVMLYGISKVVVAASEVIAIGADAQMAAVGTTTAGTGTRVESTTTGADLADMMMGLWLESVTGSSPAATLGTVLLRPMGRVTAT